MEIIVILLRLRRGEINQNFQFLKRTGETPVPLLGHCPAPRLTPNLL
jgi:hypothetical protein